jgi:hypothetical protein
VRQADDLGLAVVIWKSTVDGAGYIEYLFTPSYGDASK